MQSIGDVDVMYSELCCTLVSVVKRYTFHGIITRTFGFNRSSLLSLMYVSSFTFCFWNPKSNQQLKTYMKVPAQHTIGPISKGFVYFYTHPEFNKLVLVFEHSFVKEVCSSGEMVSLCLLIKTPFL